VPCFDSRSRGVGAIIGQPSAPGHIGGKKPVGGKESIAWRGIRLLLVLRYGVIVLALCLLLTDTFRLALSANSRAQQGGPVGLN
jgi:hypothetical protein